MGPKGQLTLFRIRGIRIGVDYSWFLVLFLIILWLSGFYRDMLGADQSESGPYLLAVASALAFFGSILLHELGHAVVANRRGIPITEITLWLFGGVARMSKDSDSPGTEFKIAVAGPAVTLVIAVALRRDRDRCRRRGRVLGRGAGWTRTPASPDCWRWSPGSPRSTSSSWSST